jgi:hypothetical protein
MRMRNIISGGRPFATNLTDFSHDDLLYGLIPKEQITFGYHKKKFFHFSSTNEKLLFITFFCKNGKDFPRETQAYSQQGNASPNQIKTLIDSDSSA